MLVHFLVAVCLSEVLCSSVMPQKGKNILLGVIHPQKLTLCKNGTGDKPNSPGRKSLHITALIGMLCCAVQIYWGPSFVQRHL